MNAARLKEYELQEKMKVTISRRVVRVTEYHARIGVDFKTFNAHLDRTIMRAIKVFDRLGWTDFKGLKNDQA